MIGDFAPGATVSTKFNTVTATGAPITLAGTPVVKAYKDGSATTEVLTGITLTVDFDGVTGLHEVAIDTSADGAFYAAGSDFTLVLTAGTVNSISVAGLTLDTFSLYARSALRPTTAGRTLAVDASGRTDLGLWVGSAPNALQSGRIDSYLGAAAAGVIAAATFAANALDAVWITAARTLTAFGFTVTAGTVSDKTGYALTTGERTAIANEVEAQIIDDTDSEKVLQAIIDKIASANPSLDDLTLGGIASAVRTELATELARLDVAISSRLAAAGYTVPPTALDNATATAAAIASDHGVGSYVRNTEPDNTGIAAIGSKTINLPSDPADQSLIIDATTAIMGRLGAPTGASISADVATRASQSTVNDLPTSAELTVALGPLATAATLAAVQAQTDKLQFDGSNRVESNPTAVNSVPLTGVGTSLDPWGPA